MPLAITGEGAVATSLTDWETFYLIVGSVAGALTGLQFVVMALVADSRRRASSPEIAAFGTPNVLHFCASLLISSLLVIPWNSLSVLAAGLTACGVAGIVYALIVIRRARRQMRYRPVLEDWIWHTILPLLSYLAVTLAGALLLRRREGALFLLAAGTLVLVFVGIHNAWDTMAYLATDQQGAPEDATPPEQTR